MAQTGWLNANIERDYPFVRESAAPHYLLADIGLFIGHRHHYQPGVDKLYLAQVVRVSANELSLVFRSDAPGLADHDILVPIWLPTAEDYHEQLIYAGQPADVDADGVVSDADRTVIQDNQGKSPASVRDGDLSGDGQVDADDLLKHTQQSLSASADVHGFVTLGDIDQIKAWLPDPGMAVEMTAYLETATALSEYKRQVDSVNVANFDRARATPAEGCRDFCWPFDLQDAYVVSSRQRGPLRLVPGYNCEIRQNTVDNSLTINGAVGRGEGKTCQEPEIFPGEAPPVGSELLGGGPTCREVFRTIAGVGGRHLQLRGGQGVSVSYSEATHTIQIDVNAGDMAVCTPDVAETPPGCRPRNDYGNDPCLCGPE